jgi:hypothetical protein
MNKNFQNVSMQACSIKPAPCTAPRFGHPSIYKTDFKIQNLPSSVFFQ